MSTYIDPNTEAWIEQLQARIAELERKPIQCHRCGDPITNELGDNPICGACALASELNVKTLQARIAEVEAENAIFRNADYDALQCGSRIAELQAENAKLKEALEKAAKLMEEYTQSCPADMYNWDHTNTCESHCETMNSGDWWKCWLDWLMGDL